MKQALEVESALDSCYSRIMYSRIHAFKRKIDEGGVKVTNDPSFKDAEFDLVEEDTFVNEEYLNCLLREETRLAKFLPREEQGSLSDIELYRYEGAICALHWLLGHQNHNMVGYLVSDRFQIMNEVPVAWLAQDKHVMRSE